MASIRCRWANVTILLLVLLSGCGSSSSSSPAPGPPTPSLPTSALNVVPTTMEPGLLIGQVTAPDGRPIAGALVGAQPAGPVAAAIPEVLLSTNEEGIFQWPLPVKVTSGQPITLTMTLVKD
jgi:hypothetical protein